MDFIPVIDLARINNRKCSHSMQDAEKQTYNKEWTCIAEEMRNALSGIGFLYLKNHGIPLDVISDAFAASAKFFSLPEHVKGQYKKNPTVSTHGWVQAGQELLHPDSIFELRECFDIAGNERFYPTSTEHANFREVMEKLEHEGKVLMRKLLKLLGISLQLEDPDYFIKCCRHLETNDNSRNGGDTSQDDDNRGKSTVGSNECDLRAIYYPAIPDNLKVIPGTVRCAEHTDYEIFTLLFQDNVGGLEVKNVTGKWIQAKPIPDTILVNTGDLLQFWTNGYYPATYHRVVIPNEEISKRTPRYSIAYFFAPDDDTVICPLKSHFVTLCSSNNEDSREEKPITAIEHIMNRVKNAYQY